MAVHLRKVFQKYQQYNHKIILIAYNAAIEIISG